MVRRAPQFLPLVFAGLTLLGFHSLVQRRMGDDPTALGYNAVELSPAYSRFLGTYLFFGLAALAGLVLALHHGLISKRRLEALREQLNQGADRTFVLALCLLALAIGFLSYRYLLRTMPITDDEGAYRFAAQILAKGRLYLPADPDKDFFDHVFLINQGRSYTQYFLGWPLLLLPALLLGAEGYANSIYFALAMPAIFLILRRLCGSFWARIGGLLALTSPMLSISAGTLLSHTSCITTLAWFLYCALRARDDDSHWAWHSGLALTFCLAFFIRPLTAVGLALPLLLGWLWDLRRRPDRGKILLAFALPSLLGAGLFFGVNQAMNGHPLRTAYAEFLAYRLQDGEIRLAGGGKEMGWSSPLDALSQAGAAFQRLSFSAFGWPISWLFVFFAGPGAERRRILLMVPCYFASHLPVYFVGIDTFAPMHYIEMALPIVLLSVLGLENLTREANQIDLALEESRGESFHLKALPLQTAAASVLIGLVGFLPYQLDAVHKSALLEKITRDAVGELEKPIVLFAIQPYFTTGCFPNGLKSWVHQWPINAPDLQDEVIWLAHVSLARDRELMTRRFPDRQAYLVTWKANGCERLFVPLDLADERDFPPLRRRPTL